MSMCLEKSEPWAPHPGAATDNRAEVESGRYYTAANGTRSCCGGWQFVFSGVRPGHRYRIEWESSWEDVPDPPDMLVGHVYWGEMPADRNVPGTSTIWDYACADITQGCASFLLESVAPLGVDIVTVRCTLRWTPLGKVEWHLPRVIDLGAYEPRPPVRVAVATGTEDGSHAPRTSLAAGVNYYAKLAEKACAGAGADLVVLPEIGPQWQMKEHAFDKAVTVPGPETEPFSQIARRHHAVLVVGLLERDGDAVFNSAVVLDVDGTVAGIYHKVHLASTEAISGVLPGDGFPVFSSAVGRIGCNICMDSSAAESSRMVGLNGAEFLVLPIMGDHRASRYDPGQPRFDEARWRAIQRTRAMDNQLCMVVARNRGRGSCIIDRSGEILAYNDGGRDVVTADVPRDDGFRKWNGGCFRQVNWRQRRPRLYGACTAAEPQALRNLRIAGTSTPPEVSPAGNTE